MSHALIKPSCVCHNLWMTTYTPGITLLPRPQALSSLLDSTLEAQRANLGAVQTASELLQAALEATDRGALVAGTMASLVLQGYGLTEASE